MSAIIPFPSHLQVGVKLRRSIWCSSTSTPATLERMGCAALPVRPEHQAAGSGAPVRHPRFGQAGDPARLQERGEFRLRPAAIPLDRLSIRLGFEPRKTSVPGRQDRLAGAAATKLLQLGIGFKISKNLDISVTGSYMTGKLHAGQHQLQYELQHLPEHHLQPVCGTKCQRRYPRPLLRI
jgi:hypothetical protein